MSQKSKGVILRIRKSRSFKGLSVCLALSMLFEVIQPSVSLALTEGPSQPEVQSFEPISTTQMVDMFSGDFNYNIPLFNLPGPNGGYPVNIAYHAGVSMDDEASWVGLGWNLNVGSLVRNMRGLPDEFESITDGDGNVTDGDFIYTKNDIKESWSLGVSSRLEPEAFGGDLFAGQGFLSLGITYDNYSGLGASVGVQGLGRGDGSSPLNMSLSLDSENGLGVSASLRSQKRSHHERYSLGISFDGKLGVDFGLSQEKTAEGTLLASNSAMQSIGSRYTFARQNFSPSIATRSNSYGFGFNLGAGNSALPAFFLKNSLGITFDIQDYDNSERQGLKKPVIGYAKNDASDRSHYTKDFVRMNDGQITEETAYLPHAYYANDAYASTGQGLSGYFRARRNDAGFVHDPMQRNTNWNISASLEWEEVVTTTTVAIPIPAIPPLLSLPPNIPIGSIATTKHFGFGGNFGFGWNTQRGWNNTDGDGKNEKATNFYGTEPLGDYETVYYQVHGENTIQDPDALDYINGTDLTWMTFDAETNSNFLKGKQQILAVDNAQVSSGRSTTSGREVRNTLVHKFSNAEVGELGEFDVKYYNLSSSLDVSSIASVSLDRSTRATVKNEYFGGGFDYEDVSVAGHDAGYKVLNADGTYYVYGLPAYNVREVQNLFSVDGTNNYSGFDPEASDVVDVVTTSQYQAGDDDVTEVNYKQNGTHKFISKRVTSAYAHSYMLSSVQGADYVDITNNGPSDDDLGYWVKFNYGRFAEDYKWRVPYKGANYSDGQTYTREDDKGSYAYGEKELWYLARIETKSHIAIFHLSERTDMVEAEGEFVGIDQTLDLTDNSSGLKIDKICVYDKASYLANASTAVPLQTVHFEYDYSLCHGVTNKDATRFATSASTPNGSDEGGKLTLKKVWFTSNGSTRGALNKYEFDYENISVPTALDGLVNPDYNKNSYDSWGNYQPFPTNGYSQHANFPYVNQTASCGWKQSWMASGYSLTSGVVQETEANQEVTKQANDLLASCWSLKTIKLPSGGEINIEYESDDYSHVQHKVANQMFKIEKLGDYTDHDEIYNGNTSDSFYDNASLDDEKRRRIYFRLEKPLPTTGMTAEDYAESIYNDYVKPLIQDENGDRNLYFKSRMLLTYDAGNLLENYDYVRGYLPLENSLAVADGSDLNYNYGVLTSTNGTIEASFTEGGVDKYAVGYVTVQATKKKNGNAFFDEYHPMALSAWTYMQTSAPKLLNPASTFNSGSPQNAGDIASQFTNLLNVVPQTMASFGAIRGYCKMKNFARYIDLENSGIRLASPDKIKFGGGHRVKNISITDNWSADGTGGTDKTYGQHYDYTTFDENGNRISSGVAAYEPQLGGDENALKYPIYMWGKNKAFTNNNLFTEAPVNEDLFPGASVGYRKVTVTSLNTELQFKNRVTDDAVGRTSGVTEYEFFTAKDFPTMVSQSYLSESNLTKDVFKVPIPIPLIGSISRNYYHGTQGFLIELNDMHGKPKSVRSYESSNYVRGTSPITESTYDYQSTPVSYQGEWVNKLDNEVTIIPKGSSSSIKDILTETMNTYKRDMGIEAEMFTDAREFKTFNQSIGLGFNVELFSFFPIMALWPSVNNSKSLLRTHVTNKVVHRTGILRKSTQRDLQASTSSEILAYDEKAGIPMIAKTTNEFGDDFYSYNIPAYYDYENMGHAYQNIDYRFRGEVVEDVANTTGWNAGNYLHIACAGDELDYLVRGDEVLVTAYMKDGQSNYFEAPTKRKGYVLGFEYSNQDKVQAIIHFPVPGLKIADFPGIGLTNMMELSLQFRVIRSGRRNHYGSMSASYTTKGIPDFDGTTTVTTTTVPSSHQILTSNLDAGTVLSASASLFRDDWTNNDLAAYNKEGNLDYTNLKIDNPYLTGNSGIWRPYKSYSYVDERSAPTAYTEGNVGSNPDLQNDGLLTSEIPMFSYAIGELERYQPKWQWVNEVTRFNGDSYEIENVNRLGIHSSALYGYDNSLTIAVGGNASIYELGAIDFEYSDDYDQHGVSMALTNLNFHNETSSASDFFVTDAIGIKYAVYDGSDLTIVTDVPYADFDATEYEEEVVLGVNSTENANGGGNKSQFLNGYFDNTQSPGTYPIGGVNYASIVVTPSIDENPQQILPSASLYTGKLRMLHKKSAPSENASSAISFVSTKAHTGKKSMRVASTFVFGQQKLELTKDKSYVVSMWVSRDNEKQATFDPESLVEIGTFNGTSFEEATSGSDLTLHKVTVSKIIEGWQKVDFEFESDIDRAVIAFRFLPGAAPLYVDDVRFAPKTGGITTYVYDPTKFWLRATLNVDNYATLYYYDEEGNLTLKKQETEEGIFTITESRGHVSENN